MAQHRNNVQTCTSESITEAEKQSHLSRTTNHVDSRRELREHKSLLNEIALGIFCSIEIKGHSARIKLLDDSPSFFRRKDFSYIKYKPVTYKVNTAWIPMGENVLLFKKSSILCNIRYNMLQVYLCLQEL